MKRVAIAIAIACAALLAACGGGAASTEEETPGRPIDPAPELLPPERVVEIEARAAEPVPPGGTGTLVVAIRIADDYHVMSDRPSRPNYIATTVELGAPDVAFDAPVFPEATPFQLEDETIATFMGAIEVRAPYRVADGAAPGPRTAHCAVGYQACTEGSCLFPTTKELDVELLVAAR